MPYSASRYSGRLRITMATRSPGSRPRSARKPAAAWAARWANCRQVACTRSPSASAGSSGRRRPWRSTQTARFTARNVALPRDGIVGRHRPDWDHRPTRRTVGGPMADTTHERWPAIPVSGWQDTRDTLHLYTQVLGKISLANEPLANHWWNTTLYLTARGFTTALMPHPTGPAFQIDLDVVVHELVVTTVDGDRRSLALTPRPVAEFYAAVLALLADLGVATAIWPVPVE